MACDIKRYFLATPIVYCNCCQTLNLLPVCMLSAWRRDFCYTCSIIAPLYAWKHLIFVSGIECPIPMPGVHTEPVEQVTVMYPQTYSYRCHPDYMASDGLTLSCLANGTWSHTPPTCISKSSLRKFTCILTRTTDWICKINVEKYSTFECVEEDSSPCQLGLYSTNNYVLVLLCIRMDLFISQMVIIYYISSLLFTLIFDWLCKQNHWNIQGKSVIFKQFEFF